jgi:hypothetical protein
MGYRESEKKRLVALKEKLFSAAACVAGQYNGDVYDFCLADEYSSENIYPFVRNEALEYFKKRGIGWHAGLGDQKSLPSTHLCCSQSACVNFLFPFVRSHENLGRVLIDMGYSVSDVLPFESDDPLRDGVSPLVVFEWIGERNYLGELKMGRLARDSERTRGANFTSADFAVRFRRTDGKIEVVLGEWKYTERYGVGISLQISKAGTDRLKSVYRDHLMLSDCQIQLPGGVQFEDLLYDPFDQMMRLQLLATAMERAKEHADIVSVLHIAPRANKDLVDRITSPGLAKAFPGRNIHEIQQVLVANDRFRGFYMEDLLPIMARHSPDQHWAQYMGVRYGGC